MKIKNKGKVYPSPSPSPSPSSSSSSSASNSRVHKDGDDFLSVLKLLPATILTLASVLSLQDREVLAYMITRSLKTTTTDNPKQASLFRDSKKKQNINHNKSPLFDCDCFECYTCYWFKWDSSPNRELIHQVIEAFEEHLSNVELFKKHSRTNKRRDKSGRRVCDMGRPPLHDQGPVPINGSSSAVAAASNDDVSRSPERPADVEEVKRVEDLATADEMVVVPRSPTGPPPPLPPAAVVNSHKGLARKVLPDVLGLFNSHLWNLWSPNV